MGSKQIEKRLLKSGCGWARLGLLGLGGSVWSPDRGRDLNFEFGVLCH